MPNERTDRIHYRAGKTAEKSRGKVCSAGMSLRARDRLVVPQKNSGIIQYFLYTCSFLGKEPLSLYCAFCSEAGMTGCGEKGER